MSELINILEIEVGNRLDDDSWTQDNIYTNLWYLTHVPGKPSRIEENGVELTEQSSAEDVNDNPGSWIWGEDAVLDSREKIGDFEFGITKYYSYAGKKVKKYWNLFDADIGFIYIHSIGSDDPSNYTVVAYFWEYLTNAQYVDEDVEFNGNIYLPYLKSDYIPALKAETSGYEEGGTKQGFGTISIINTDGRYDSRLADYIYEAKKYILRTGQKGDAFADFNVASTGWTGGVEWNDRQINIETEDLRRYNA